MKVAEAILLFLKGEGHFTNLSILEISKKRAKAVAQQQEIIGNRHCIYTCIRSINYIQMEKNKIRSVSDLTSSLYKARINTSKTNRTLFYSFLAIMFTDHDSMTQLSSLHMPSSFPLVPSEFFNFTL